MASSENYLPSFPDPWAFRPAFQDPWIPDPFSKETQALSKALHSSLDPDSLSSFLDSIAAQSPPLSGVSDTPPPPPPPSKRHKPPIPIAAGKVSKRKSRANKRNHTTFITADPANFRQMVQQVTGFRLGNSPVQIPPVLKPEPHRPAAARFCAGLPTLDTSAFLLNQHSSRSGSEISGPDQLEFGPGLGYPNDGPVAPDFDAFSSFPTLESWKAGL